jgi:hypothetical protein
LINIFPLIIIMVNIVMDRSASELRQHFCDMPRTPWILQQLSLLGKQAPSFSELGAWSLGRGKVEASEAPKQVWCFLLKEIELTSITLW